MSTSLTTNELSRLRGQMAPCHVNNIDYLCDNDKMGKKQEQSLNCAKTVESRCYLAQSKELMGKRQCPKQEQFSCI